MANGAKIRVLIADDHAILRAGLRMLIDSQPDMKVIAEAPNGEEAVRLAGASALTWSFSTSRCPAVADCVPSRKF